MPHRRIHVRQRVPLLEGCDLDQQPVSARRRQHGRRMVVLLALAILVGSPVTPAAALDLDPATLSRLPPGTPLRWDNVKGAPAWVGGVHPVYDRSTRWHAARLPPGASITVRLPPRGLVRVAALPSEREIGDVQFWASDGSGLYRQVVPAVSATDQSLVVAPNLSDAGLLRIERPRAADCAVFLAVFTSRRIDLDSADSFLTPVTPSGPTVELSLDGSPQRRVWGWLRPGQPTHVTACGPARLRLDTRLQYAVGESSARQAYRLQISVDGEAPQIVELETSSESRHVVSIDGVPRVVGRSEVEYLDLPPGGHQVTITSTACLYLHVLSTSLASNVIPAAFHAGGPLGITPDSWQSLWQRPDATYAQLLQQEPIDLQAYKAAVLRSARDNRYREGGLRAWWLLQSLSAGHPELKDLHRWAERTGQFHTRFRNLLPVRQSVPVRLRTAWCTPRSLGTMDAEPASTVLAEQFVQDAIDKLCRAHFVRFPAGQSAEAAYLLPEQLGPTQLRVLVDPSCPSDDARLWLSIDDHPPVALRMIGQSTVLETEREPTKAEVGLAAQYWRQPQFDAGTLGGPFAMRRTPARWAQVGAAEWTLPRGARKIQLRCENPAGEPVDVCLQFRGGRPYELTETAYLEFRRRARCEGWTLLQSLQSATTPAGSDPTAAEELRNHWLPLRRWLTARQQDFAADLVPPPTPSEPPIGRSAVQITADLQRARQLSQSGDWLLALESWSRLVPHVSADLRCEALQERTRALEQLQEPYLVERELRGMVCFDPDPQVRAMAAAYLRQRYEREADLHGLETLAATELLREPTAERLGEVTRVLLQAGEWSLALMAGSELLPQTPPADLLLAASQLGWWQVFEELRRGLPAGPVQQYWIGVRCLAQGHAGQADQHLGQAGVAGSVLRRHLQWGQQILPQLRNPDRSVRLAGIVAWENWQAQYPGPWSWQPDHAAVIQCAGTASVYVVERDQYSQYYRAQPNQPVWLELQGPVMVQLEARPLHNAGEDQALHDELMVRGAGREHLFPINNNRAATGLEIVEHPTQVPGYRIGGTLTLGPGRHRLQVSAGRTQVLVRAHLRQPVGLLPVLPPLTCPTVQAVLDGCYGTTVAVHPEDASQDPSPSARPAPQLLLPEGRLQSLPLVRPAEPVDAATHVTVFTPLQMARWSFRQGTIPPQHLPPLLAWATRDRDPTTAGERNELLIQYVADLRSLHDSGQWRVAPFVEQAVWLHRGQVDQATAVDPAGELSACRQRLALLTRLAEGDSENRQGYRVMLAEQMDRWPWLSDLTAVEARVMGGSRWSLFREFESSAGIQPVQQPVFASENPGLRVRRALFAHPEPFDHLLSGRGELRLRLRSARNTVTQLTLNRPQLSYLRATPVHVSWQADDQPPQHVNLERPHDPKQLNVSLPPGDHLIRLRLDQPIAGQYVLVQIHELLASEGRQRWTEQPDARPEERLYQVATRAEPLRFRVFGPTRIRIDERAGNSTRTRYFHVLTTEQQFELSPPAGSESALFRVFEWVEDPQQAPLEIARPPTPPPQHLSVWLDQLPPAYLADSSAVDPACFAAPAVAWGDPVGLLSLAAPNDPPQAIELPDAFPLGGQEKGSWAVGSGAFSRRPVDEDFQSGAPDEFVELRIGYDQFDAVDDSSTRTDTLLRLREASGPTWGLGHQRWWTWSAEGNATSQPQYGRPLPPNDLFLFWDLYGFLQAPSGALSGDESDVEGSLGTQLRLYRRWSWTERTWHYPAVTGFARWLSLDEVRYEAGHVDQDVFTLYKSDHRIGLRLSDTWVHQPRNDTQFWLRPALMTNENLNPFQPDHVTLQTGCATYLGGVILDLSYRVTRYSDDGDRQTAVTQQFLYCDALWEHWQHAGSRYELGVQVRHELSEGDTSANLVLIRYLSNGRGYRDMPPGTVDFHALRQQRHLGAWIREYARPH